MKPKSLISIAFLFLIHFSCSDPGDNEQAPAIKTVFDSKNHFLINNLGDTIFSGIPRPAPGKPIHPDSVSRSEITSLGSLPSVVPALTNVHIAGKPRVVQIPKNLKRIVPGQNGVPTPKTIPVHGDTFRVKEPLPVIARPPQMKESAIANFQFLDPRHGLTDHSINSLLADSKGRLWFGSMNSGAIVYDGNRFTTYSTIEGFSNESRIMAMVEDKHHNLWFGFGVTGSGVIRYDGDYFTHFKAENGLSNNQVSAMTTDSKGHIWIGTYGGGLNRYDPENHSLTIYSEEQGLSSNYLISIMEDSRGGLWLGTRKEGVSYFDGIGFTHFTTKEGLSSNSIKAIGTDRGGNIWIGTDKGVNLYDGNSFSHFTRQEGLSGNRISAIFEDHHQGKMWFGTEDGGLSCYDPNTYDGRGTFTHYTTEEGLSSDFITSIVKDLNGNLWFGTREGGVVRHSIGSFNHYNLRERLDLEYCPILSLTAGSDGKIWYGTAGEGFGYYDGADFTHYQISENREYNYFLRILEDSDGSIWLGSRLLEHFNRVENTTTSYPALDTIIFSLLQDETGNLWISHRMAGLTHFKGAKIIRYTTEEGLSHNWILSSLQDGRGRPWFGTRGGGVCRFDPADPGSKATFTCYATGEDFNGNIISSMLKASDGVLWFGSKGNGLIRYDPEIDPDGQFTTYTVGQDFQSNDIRSILEDRQKNIWLSTKKGIVVLVPHTSDNLSAKGSKKAGYYIFTFKHEDGLKNTNHHLASACLDSLNRIWWGTTDGLTMLDLNRFRLPQEAPTKVGINHIEINQQFIDYRGLADITYRNTLPFGKALSQAFDYVMAFHNYPVNIRLPYQLNHLTFHFSAIDWAAPYKIKYRFFMEGVDKTWSVPQADPQADYRGLPPGTHTLKVEAIGAAQKWSDRFEYTFTILPPWWLSWWAYLIYALAIVAITHWIYQFQLHRRLAREETIRLKELDAIKTKLYANITHEFRTPLTVISGMADRALQEPQKWFREGLTMIQRNARLLLNLVHQMLDLAKLESQSMPLNMQQGEVVPFLKYIAQSFQAHAATKTIKLHFFSKPDQLMMDFDPDKLAKVMGNLFSNAIKFTPYNGDIYIHVDLEKNFLTIEIKDTGIGIPKAHLPHVFDRFYQVDPNSYRGSTHKEEGTGIGLALTKELVLLMKGQITVKSKAGEGAEFTVQLPISNMASIRKVLPPEDHKFPFAETWTGKTWEAPSSTGLLGPLDLPTALIIEDNRDVARYIASCLEDQYQLEMAYNGREGIERALELIPDIIISDVMMPEMDGYEVIAMLKKDERTSHIPILLLTAKADLDSKIKGLEEGADAYLHKPFEPRELEVRLRKLIKLRQQFQQRYRSLETPGETGDKTLQKEDAFLQKLRTVVLDHMDNEQFSIPFILRAMGVSRSQLHQKLKALTGKSTSQVIRSIRLQKAKSLLESSDLNVTEVAYAVGFNNPNYFSKCFSEHFSVNPREIKKDRDLQ